MKFVPIKETMSVKTGAVVVFLPKGAGVSKELKALDAHLGGMIVAALKTDDFKEQHGETMLLYTAGKIAAPRLLLVGLGEEKDLYAEKWYRAVGVATQFLQTRRLGEWTAVIPERVVRKIGVATAGTFFAKAVGVGSYQFSAYKTNKAEIYEAPKQVGVAGLRPADAKKFFVGLEEGGVIADAVNFVRDLGNKPPGEVTPTYLANAARGVSKAYPKVRVQVLDRAAMKKLNMGGVLGVSQGSTEPPAFIIMEYFGAPRAQGTHVFVGKGITFDSGGISLKPGDKMDEMKFDMLGGAAVIGAIRLIASRGLRVNVVGLVPATENLPSGSAYRPGDILRTHNGKTIEVLNTDAEGRIILADALGYAAKYKPKAMVDLATLTGAIVIALGEFFAGLFTNDVKVERRMNTASRDSGDMVWSMPVTDDYSKMIKSEVADVKNIAGREGGSCTAAAFLKEFVSYPWAHVDIASTAWNMKAQPWMRAGATGFGVHLLYEVAKRLK